MLLQAAVASNARDGRLAGASQNARGAAEGDSPQDSTELHSTYQQTQSRQARRQGCR